MRVSESVIYETYLKNLEDSRTRWFKYNQQVSSGKKLQRPSDNPSDSARVVRVREDFSTINQYFRNITRATSKLNIASEALNTMRNLTTKVAERGDYALTGTLTQEDRDSIANDIRGILDAFVHLAETTVDGDYIFGGTRNDVSPVQENPDGTYSYVGNSEAINIEIGDKDTVQTNVTGDELFSAAGMDILNTLVGLINNLEAGDIDAAKVSLESVQDGARLIDTARVRLGTNINRSEEIRGIHERRLFELTNEISSLEDSDMAESITKMTQAETALRATLGAGSKLTQQNLFDFLG